MLQVTEGDFAYALNAVFRDSGEPLDVSSDDSLVTLTGVLIAPDGTRTEVTPSVVTDGTDGAVRYSGSAEEALTPGLWSYQFFATFTVGRRSTPRISFLVTSNA